VARSANEKQKRVENQKDFIVGVNCFNGPHEIDVRPKRSVEEVYSAELKESAGERQKANLKKLKQERNNDDVAKYLAILKANAQDEQKNLMPAVLNCVKCYATLQEICDTLRDVFGEAKASTI